MYSYFDECMVASSTQYTAPAGMYFNRNVFGCFWNNASGYEKV